MGMRCPGIAGSRACDLFSSVGLFWRRRPVRCRRGYALRPIRKHDRCRRQSPGRGRYHPFLLPRAPGRLQPIDEGLKGLYATGLFQDIKIRQAGGRLIVTVVENPVINRIAFEGNVKAKDEQLHGEIQSKARGTLSRPMVQSDTQRIIETLPPKRAVSTFRWCRRSSSCRTIASIWSSKSPRARRPASRQIRFVGNRHYARLPAEGHHQDQRDRIS